MTQTLSSLLGEVGGLVTQFVPDFAVYVAGAFLVGITAMGVRRFIRALK